MCQLGANAPVIETAVEGDLVPIQAFQRVFLHNEDCINPSDISRRKQGRCSRHCIRALVGGALARHVGRCRERRFRGEGTVLFWREMSGGGISA